MKIEKEMVVMQTVIPSVDLMDVIISMITGSRTSAMSSFSRVDNDANKL